MKAFRTVVLFGLAGALFAALSYAQPGPAAQRGTMRLMDELSLSAEQKKDIDKIIANTMKEQIDRRASIGKARVDLRELLRAESPNQSAIEKKLGEITQMESQARVGRLNTWFVVNRLLNADQQKIWKQALERHMAFGNRAGMRGRMDEDGFGRRGDGPMKGGMDRRGPRR